MNVRRALGPFLGVVLAIALYWQSHALDAVAQEDQLGPGFWPRLVLTGLGLACAAKTMQALLRRPRRRPRQEPGAVVDLDPGQLPGMSSRILTAAVVLVVLYVVATPWLGFPLATAAFIVAFMTVAGARSVLSIATSAVVGSGSLLYLFVKLVYLPLPKGAGPFEAITLALYRGLGIL